MKKMDGYLSTPIESIPINVELPFALFVRIGTDYVLFRQAGDTVTSDRYRMLAERAEVIFVLREAWHSFLNYMEAVCQLPIKDPVVAAENMHNLLVAYGRHLEEARTLDARTVDKLRGASIQLVEIAHQGQEAQKRLLKRYTEKSIYFSTHGGNVAVYGIAMGRKLGLSEPDLGLLAFSCLLHNIGKSELPRELLYKEDPLTEGDWVTLRTHTTKGASLLQKLHVPEEAVLTAEQHHECIDGNGYPNAIKGSGIHLFAKICTIADVYDALTSHRPYGSYPVTPANALKKMQTMTGKFDPRILNMMLT